MMKDSLSGHIPSIFTSLAKVYRDGKYFNSVIEVTYDRPKLNLKVWRLDQYGKLDNIAYGVINLPNETGSFELECPTWRPMSGWREESYSYYLGGPPKLLNSDPIVRDLNQRRFLTSMSSGTVHIHCEVLMKAFRDTYISGDK
jgi:Ciliary basal body-associated, B9 protein